MKINAPTPVAHDLVIWGGYIRCYDKPAEAHQDGIQALGGERHHVAQPRDQLQLGPRTHSSS